MLRLESRPANIEGEGQITIRDLVRNSLRMRPDRIIVGEIRGAEALDMLQAMNTGHEGSLSTVHANSPRDALHRVEIAPTGSDLDAVLREAAEIARRRPAANVQRRHHPTSGRGARLESILILEPTWPPHALRAFLILPREYGHRLGQAAGPLPVFQGVQKIARVGRRGGKRLANLLARDDCGDNLF